jgi:transcriptional regulator with XRE-family HTH domain
MTNFKDFGAFLSKERERSGYKSQRQLALDAGISPATLSRIESGIQEPKPETLKAIAKFLKSISYEELMEKAGYLEDSTSPQETHSNDSTIGRAFYGGADLYTEEELEIARAAAQAAVEAYR